jgi:hypothetical protein
MRSPCHDCGNGDTDKNNSICLKCDKRVKYAQGLNVCLDPSIIIKRRDEVMSVRGTCKNCEREDMSLPAMGLCGRCNGAWKAAPEGMKEAALAQAKVNAKSGRKLSWGTRNKPKIGEPTGLEAYTSEVIAGIHRTLDPDKEKAGLYLEFKDDRDQGILKWLNESAENHRRRPDQEILWILQNYIEAVEGKAEGV